MRIPTLYFCSAAPLGQRTPSIALLGALAAAVVAACAGGDGSPSDTDPDAIVIGDTGGDAGSGDDSGSDVGADTEADSSTDAGTDAGEPDAGPAPCDDNLDCRGGELCRDGFCREACRTAADCDEAGLPICGPDGFCVGCVADTDCGQAEICDANVCTLFCRADGDCGEGYACEPVSGECIEIECFSSGDCGAGEYCIDGACIDGGTLACAPGTALCSGPDVLRCLEDGSAYETLACADDAPCLEGGDETAACEPLLCVPDAIGCVDLGAAYLCEPDGRSLVEAPCRETQICVAGVCVIPECEPATTTCDGDRVVVCDGEGRVVSDEACATQSECITSPGGCACRAGACVELACVPDSARCVGNAVQACAPDGSGYSAPADCGAQFCVEGECLDRVCEPSTVTCRGEVIVACSGDGASATTTDCAASDRICVESAGGAGCNPPVCDAGTVECNAAQTARLVCDARGAALVEVACGAGRYCSGGSCRAQICTPGSAPVCSGNNVIACNDVGSAYETLATCGDSGCDAGACVDPCADSTGTERGCDFWAVDLENYRYSCTSDLSCASGETCVGGYCTPSPYAHPFGVAVANDNASEVEVRILSRTGALLGSGFVAANSSATFTVPSSAASGSSIDAAFRITSTLPVTVWQYNPLQGATDRTNESSLLLPTAALDNEYVVASWQTRNDTALLHGYFTIVATEPGATDVQVRLTTATQAATVGAPVGYAAGGPYSLRLYEGQTLTFSTTAIAGADLTGSVVTATQNIAVFGGHTCANVPLSNFYCDHIEEQLLPTSQWASTQFALRSPARGTEPDLFRVIAATDGTTVSVTPAQSGFPVTLNRGQYADLYTTQSVVFGATQPVQVVQYLVGSEYPAAGQTCTRDGTTATDVGCLVQESSLCSPVRALGDPAMTVVPPRASWRTRFRFWTSTDYVQHRLTVAAAPGTTYTLNGASVTPTSVTTVGGLSVGFVTVSAAGSNVIEASAAFSALLASYGCGHAAMAPLGYEL